MAVPSIVRLGVITPLAILWRAGVLARARLTRARANPGRRHVLMMGWMFPPHHATGVHVPVSFARHASLAGWDVSVVTSPAPPAPTPAGRALMALLPEGVKIHRVSRAVATDELVRLFPMPWAVPEVDGGALTAVAMASKALSSLAHDPPSVVFASGPAFCNFLAARWIAEAFRARLVLQYRDEWTVNTPSFVDVGRHDRAEEMRCLARADLVSFVSEGKKAGYREAFPWLDPRKLNAVPNGWEPYFHETARTGTDHLGQAPDTFTLTYTGRWHASMAPLLAALESALREKPEWRRKLRVVFLGWQTMANRELMRQFSASHPGVLTELPADSPTVAIEVQRESSALLLINDHIYDGVVPLKTFDYMQSSRPILVFGRTGGAAKIVTDLGAGLAVNVTDCGAFITALERLMDSEAGQWNTPARKAWSARQNRAVLTATMLDAIEGVERPARAIAQPDLVSA